MYRPLQTKAKPRVSHKNSFMPKKGLDLEDLAQVLDVNYALVLRNYIPQRYGLEKRKGLSKIIERSGTDAITLLKEYSSGVWIFGYSTKIEAYNTATDTYTTIKDDFLVNNGFDGARYGDYFFVCNGVEKINRISQTLAYDAQTANFTTGLIVTGVTSGATAVVLEDNDGGTTGTLTLGNISGIFENNEALEDSSNGAAVVNGTLTYAIEEITASPICNGLSVLGPRLHGFNLIDDSTADRYSDVDDGTNPPFDDWTIGAAATDGGKVSFRNAGTARSVLQLGQFTLVFSDDGYYAYFLNTFDSAGTLTKTEVIQEYVTDFGGARGAISTPKGLFYVNEAGLWQMVSVGVQDQPASRQQQLTSTLLGSAYFDGVDFSNTDLIYDANQKIVLVTVAKESATNNLVIGCKPELNNAFFEISQWNISRFAKSGDKYYGASSVNAKVWQLFEGYSDDGFDIGTEMYQEIPMDGLFVKNKLKGLYAGGFLSPSTTLDIRFDIYDVTGKLITDKTTYRWSTQRSLGGHTGWGTGGWGGSSWGGDYDTTGLVESFDGGSPRISNFQRLRVRITGGDKLRHILNWIALKIEQKDSIRRRNITKIT